MALKKTIAGYFIKVPTKVEGNNGEMLDSFVEEWVEQKHVDMHPLEERCIRAHWNKHEHIFKLASLPTVIDEQNMLIENGIEFVRSKREESERIKKDVESALALCQEEEDKALKEWCDHVDHCLAHGLDKDSHDKEKYNNK